MRVSGSQAGEQEKPNSARVYRRFHLPGNAPRFRRAGGRPARKPDRRLSACQRIAEGDIFREAFRSGRRYTGKLMVMWLRSGEDASLCLGVVAGIRSFRRAVERSRARRLLREAYRLNRFRLRGLYDVVLVARRAIIDASRQTVEKELLMLAEKAGILKRESEIGKAGKGGGTK